jgi:shikimate dehydrogenase
MVTYGLVGRHLAHSFSQVYFEKKFLDLKLEDHWYDLFELHEISELETLLNNNPDLKGFNVTIPYKEEIIPFLSYIDPEAHEIGAVNCIKIIHGALQGYNTDAYGFSQSIKPFLDTNHQRALILGTGGASKAVAYVLNKIGVEVFYATTSEKKGDNYFFYDEINERMMNAFKLIVNTTPVGMFPDTDSSPKIPYEFFTPEHLAYDLIYNPEQTEFLRKASEQGAITVNGLSMLHLQAEKSWEIWNS